MHIIIAGAGKVGINLAKQLSAEGHDLTLIDSNRNVLGACMEQMDVMAVHGNCASMNTLLQAGIKDADLLIAVTNADEINLLCCTTAHGINEKLHTIARIRNPEYTDQIYQMRDTFGLSMVINPENFKLRHFTAVEATIGNSSVVIPPLDFSPEILISSKICGQTPSSPAILSNLSN